jgi:hypothetical protein
VCVGDVMHNKPPAAIASPAVLQSTIVDIRCIAGDKLVICFSVAFSVCGKNVSNLHNIRFHSHNSFLCSMSKHIQSLVETTHKILFFFLLVVVVVIVSSLGSLLCIIISNTTFLFQLKTFSQ